MKKETVTQNRRGALLTAKQDDNTVKSLELSEGPSVVGAKAAMRGHFKTGHMEWPGT